MKLLKDILTIAGIGTIFISIILTGLNLNCEKIIDSNVLITFISGICLFIINSLIPGKINIKVFHN